MSVMRRANNTQSRNGESGNGATGIFMYVLVLSLVVSGFLWVTDWIYDTKEHKVQARWEMHLNRIRGGSNLIDRGPGEYQVSCHPGLSDKCS